METATLNQTNLQLGIIPFKNRLENEIFINKVVIDVELAKKLLDTMTNNRTIKEAKVSKIEEELKNNTWVVNNGETIKLNNQGRLIDGQHRLKAVFNCKIPMTTYIVFNCDLDSINTIDTGASRSLTDVLKINNIKYYNTVGSIVQSESIIIKGISTRNMSKQTKFKSYVRILDVVNENLEYLYFVSKQSGIINNKFRLLTSQLIAKYFNVAYKIDKDICFAFFNQLSTGKNCETSVYLLREALIKDSSKSIKKYSVKEKEALLIKSWNHFVDGSDLKALRWQASSEKFPKMKRVEFIKNKF